MTDRQVMVEVPGIPALKQEYSHQFKVNLGYSVRHCLKTNKNQTKAMADPFIKVALFCKAVNELNTKNTQAVTTAYLTVTNSLNNYKISTTATSHSHRTETNLHSGKSCMSA